MKRSHIIYWGIKYVTIFIQTQLLSYLAQQGQFDMDPGPEACAQVRGAGEDVAEPLVPHELPASLLDQTLHLGGRQSVTSHCYTQTKVIDPMIRLIDVYILFTRSKLFTADKVKRPESCWLEINLGGSGPTQTLAYPYCLQQFNARCCTARPVHCS